MHPKKLFLKPRSQSEAMMQVAKSIESSSREQEKNRDERLKILLDAERKRDELFYAHKGNKQRQTEDMKCFWLNYLQEDHQLHIQHKSKIMFRWPIPPVLL